MKQLAKRLWLEEQADGLFEYALILLLVSMTAVTTVRSFALTVSGYYSVACRHVAGTGRGGSLAGGSLGYGVQNNFDGAAFSTGTKSLNTR